MKVRPDWYIASKEIRLTVIICVCVCVCVCAISKILYQYGICKNYGYENRRKTIYISMQNVVKHTVQLL